MAFRAHEKKSFSFQAGKEEYSIWLPTIAAEYSTLPDRHDTSFSN